jgi:hypothetical protein
MFLDVVVGLLYKVQKKRPELKVRFQRYRMG